METRKAAILYYSRTGNTRNIANRIRETLTDRGIKTDQIEILVEGKMGLRRIGKLSKGDSELQFLNTGFNPSDFDMLVMGTPVWGGEPALPFTAYLRNVEGDEGIRVGLFITGMRATRNNESTIETLQQETSRRGFGDPMAKVALKFRRGKLVEGEGSIPPFIDALLVDL